MLRLKIENFDRLPNGGPLEFIVDKRGFDFGRDQHLDWTLPDKTRVVSGKHCEVRYRENAYWLHDVSTNGTFVNGSTKRMQSPYRLADGDRLSIGEYVLAVNVAVPETVAAAPPPQAYAPPEPPPPAPRSENIWDSGSPAPPPIDPRSLMPAVEHAPLPDILHQAAYVPPPFEPEPARKPTPAVAANPWGAPASVAEAPPPAIVADAPAPAVAGPASDGGDVIRRFAKGAGVSPETFGNASAGDVAELSGLLLNLMCQHMMSLLHARAEAKTLSRSGSRTMIQAADNNPLKFMPTPEEALRVMFGPKTRGYLDARQTIESSFADLKTHQVATLAAMQTALTKLVEDLSPESIAKSAETKKSLLPGAKGKQWDTFVELWTAKAGKHEHGMLGAYLDLFAEHYDKLSKHR